MKNETAQHDDFSGNLSHALFTNRFPLPAVDHSRVKLENTENDYINASLVVMEEAQRSYILTQAS